MRLLLALALFCLTLSPLTATAQTQPPGLQEQQKEQAYQQYFELGIDAMQNKNFANGLRAFALCIRLYPDRPTPYYNLACIYSLMGRKKEALDQLEEALKKGFSSFEHMTRDTDLDNIRKETRFVEMVKKYKVKTLSQSSSLHIKGPKGSPLLVFLHGNNTPESMLDSLKDAAKAGGFGVLLPRARGQSWSQAGESIVLNEVQKALKEHGYDASKVIIGGYSVGAYQALDIALNQGKKFQGVVSFGQIYSASEMDKLLPKAKQAGLKVFMVSGRQDPLIESAREARNALANAKIPVVFRRTEGLHTLPDNWSELTVEGFQWVTGKALKTTRRAL